MGGTFVPTARGLVRLSSVGDPVGKPWQPLGILIQTNQGPRLSTQFQVNCLEPITTVESSRGYRLRGSSKHCVTIVDEMGAWVLRRIGDIRQGDCVPLALRQLVGEPQEVKLPPLPEMQWTREHGTRVPRVLTAELAELLGYFMGDGSLHSKGIRLCVAADDIDVVEHLRRLGVDLFGIQPVMTARTGYTEVALNSVRLTLWWEACGFAKHTPHEGHTGKGYTPHVPDAILHTNDRRVYAAFLRGLFDADGTIHSGYPSWTTASICFADEVQALLLALGYPTTRKHGTSGFGSHLAVLRLLNSSYNDRWLDEIGFLSARKNSKVLSSIGRQAARQDHIPVTRRLVDRLVPSNDRLRKVLLMEVARGRVSRRAAMELFDRTHDAELGHLLEFFYDEISSTDLGEEEPTFDLLVAERLPYVANGFLSHSN